MLLLIFLMSAITKSILKQTSLLYRVNHLNIARRALPTFSTSVRYSAESTTTNEDVKPSSNERKSYDSVRKYRLNSQFFKINCFVFSLQLYILLQ